LAEDDDRLWFAGCGRGEFRFDEDHGPGKFVEGLWERDLIELFLLNRENGRYAEWNLAPGGAWWAAVFRAPRERILEWPCPGAEATAEVASGRWQAVLSLPKGKVHEMLGGAPTPGNLTAIIGTPRPQCLSLAELGNGEPDFHRPGEFPELQPRNVDPGFPLRGDR
jgi:hypothetical protein